MRYGFDNGYVWSNELNETGSARCVVDEGEGGKSGAE